MMWNQAKFNLLYGDGAYDQCVKCFTEAQAMALGEILRRTFSHVQLWHGIDRLHSF